MRQGRASGTATVLFSDLEGSTELLSQLGEAAFDTVRRAHFEALRRAIDRTGAEDVTTLGDGVPATFGSAADAVACAVSVQQAVDGQVRRQTRPHLAIVVTVLGDEGEKYLREHFQVEDGPGTVVTGRMEAE
jgi:class 3 adenylate cyclase